MAGFAFGNLRRVQGILASCLRSHARPQPAFALIVSLAAGVSFGQTSSVPATKIYRGSVVEPCVQPERLTQFSFKSLDEAVQFVLSKTPSYADCRNGVFRYYDLLSSAQTGPRSHEIVGRSQHDGSTRTLGGILVQHDCPPQTNVGSDTCRLDKETTGAPVKPAATKAGTGK